MMRPKLRIGDVVKLSKRGREALKPSRFYNSKTNMLVLEVSGDGQDRFDEIICKVTCDGKPTFLSFHRKELWATGYNIYENVKPAAAKSAAGAPKNNDGRHECFMCKHPTRITGGGMYNVCANQQCGWFEN